MQLQNSDLTKNMGKIQVCWRSLWKKSYPMKKYKRDEIHEMVVVSLCLRSRLSPFKSELRISVVQNESNFILHSFASSNSKFNSIPKMETHLQYRRQSLVAGRRECIEWLLTELAHAYTTHNDFHNVQRTGIHVVLSVEQKPNHCSATSDRDSPNDSGNKRKFSSRHYLSNFVCCRYWFGSQLAMGLNVFDLERWYNLPTKSTRIVYQKMNMKKLWQKMHHIWSQWLLQRWRSLFCRSHLSWLGQSMCTFRMGHKFHWWVDHYRLLIPIPHKDSP